ncbi:hypothetical protein PISMIDRAFT_486647 [Pisolithus microcarpus 441]|uniref:Uncharacterized protein n=1 Tax=Pisolithus microcarpus 441 TaxID=765257 RepID=A0A0D0AC35_9AGAM|nr:hypothetical protein BKA83DRAFT_486647 [Pisolithus microcarpus]KIK29573.1 hypothetical protein PISMIDRAFT_486647 [Pisolithus microcarpus 441]
MDTATCVVRATFVSCGSFKKKDAPNSLIILSPIQGCHQLIQGTPFPSVRPLSMRRFSVINPKSPLMPTETLLGAGQIDYDSAPLLLHHVCPAPSNCWLNLGIAPELVLAWNGAIYDTRRYTLRLTNSRSFTHVSHCQYIYVLPIRAGWTRPLLVGQPERMTFGKTVIFHVSPQPQPKNCGGFTISVYLVLRQDKSTSPSESPSQETRCSHSSAAATNGPPDRSSLGSKTVQYTSCKTSAHHAYALNPTTLIVTFREFSVELFFLVIACFSVSWSESRYSYALAIPRRHIIRYWLTFVF